MRILRFLLRKEFLQIIRNKSILPIIIVSPIMQLILLPFAANYEMKNISISIVDHDKSQDSRRLIEKILSGKYFLLQSNAESYTVALEDVEQDKADVILEIPAGFGRDLVRDNKVKTMIAANAINGQTAGLAVSYLNSIIMDFNSEIRMQWAVNPAVQPIPVIEISSLSWFNPLMNYKFFMVPGVMAILVTLVGFMLSTMNVVREKEIGTIEQLNVTPITKTQLILSKLVPFWILGQIVLTVGFIISFIVYHIIPAGNILLVYAFSSVYLVAILGLGLFVSTFAETQQQAMFIAYFCMTTFILLGGIFASIDNMPRWAQMITYINPISYFIDVLRMIILKGSGFADLSRHFLIMFIFAISLNMLAVWHYKKTS
ncbi:MAG: ABC transporter permease [Ignavibacteria bacterium]|nr:ABC transporter permease [Ignavibacteria bacterium]